MGGVRSRVRKEQAYHRSIAADARECSRAATVKQCDAMIGSVEDTVIDGDRRATMEAILARDQRTTSHRVLERGAKPVATTTRSTAVAAATATRSPAGGRDERREHTDACDARKPGNDPARRHFRCESCLVRASYDDRGARSRRIASVTTTTWLRLGSLLVTLLAVSVQGAPTMTLEDRRMSSTPKWVNPCGLSADDIDGDMDVTELRDDQLLSLVELQAKNALAHAEMFRRDYVKRTFNVDFDDLHSTWKDNHYDWLPSPKEIPKQLGEPLNQEFLDKLEINEALLNAYEYMQKFAVGIEQILWDQEDNQLEFRNMFKETDNNLRGVLCELQVALVERSVHQRPDVSRDIMSSEYRTMSSSATYRNLRDWLIFRDYMNGLEYLVQVVVYLRQHLES